MRIHSFPPSSEPKLNNPTGVEHATRGLKVRKVPGPKGIPNKSLKHLPLSIVSLLVVIFNAFFRTSYFPVSWKHARVFSIPKHGKDQALSSSYRHLSLLDTMGKLFERILFIKILCEVFGRGLPRNEQFGLTRP